eukprot:m.58691 g.58691  ORF g.58691 m.58691 type:complete len:91 (-) comp9423_c0_seq1:19-291(-)
MDTRALPRSALLCPPFEVLDGTSRIWVNQQTPRSVSKADGLQMPSPDACFGAQNLLLVKRYRDVSPIDTAGNPPFGLISSLTQSKSNTAC